MSGGKGKVLTFMTMLHAAAFDLQAYLERIGLSEAPAPTVDGLKALHRAHRLAIPFENLDVALGRGISLNPDAVFTKLVTQRRGGYCFEQNQLFGRALAALGFTARPLLARVWLMAQDVPPTSHRLELVCIDGQDWIADAGFGGAFTPPMPLRVGEAGPEQDGAHHRLRTDAEHGWMLERLTAGTPMDERVSADGDWQAQYSFTLRDVHPADLELCNHWTSTRPGTRFTSLTIASKITPDGFVALTDGALSISTAVGNSRCEFDSPAAMHAVLTEHFGIDLPVDELARLPHLA